MSSARNNARGGFRLLPLLVLLAYLAYVHFQALHGAPERAAVALPILLGALLVAALFRRAWGVALGVVGALALAAYLMRHDAQWLLVYAPPVLINLALCLVFGLSLRPQSIPLVTRFARALDGELDAAQLSYTRGVTWAWTGLFALLTIQSVLLSMYAPLWLWSLFANGINYLLVAALFVVEYSIRVRRLKHVSHAGFWGFLVSLRRLDWRNLLRNPN